MVKEKITFFITEKFRHSQVMSVNIFSLYEYKSITLYLPYILKNVLGLIIFIFQNTKVTQFLIG